jgi:hypothetical protein
VSDLPTWARVLLYAAGAIATAVVLYAVVYLAVRSALRGWVAEQRAAARRQEDLLRGIATSAEYVADVVDAWAEGEATRRAGASTREFPAVPAAATASSSSPDHDHAGAGERGD